MTTLIARLKRLASATWSNMYLWAAVGAVFAVEAAVAGRAFPAAILAFFAGGNLACAVLDRSFKSVVEAGDELAKCCDQWAEAYQSQGRRLAAAIEALNRKGGVQ